MGACTTLFLEQPMDVRRNLLGVQGRGPQQVGCQVLGLEQEQGLAPTRGLGLGLGLVQLLPQAQGQVVVLVPVLVVREVLEQGQ